MNYFLVCLIMSCICSFSFAQTKNEIIEDVHNIVETIHMDTVLKSVTLLNQEFLSDTTDRGGELTGFYKKKKIYYIYRSVGKPYGEEIMQFYYWKSKLVFVSEKFNTYVYDDRLKVFDYTVVNTTFTGKYYFDNEKLIHKVITGHKKFDDSTIDTESSLLGKSKSNIELVKKRM